MPGHPVIDPGGAAGNGITTALSAAGGCAGAVLSGASPSGTGDECRDFADRRIADGGAFADRA